MTEIPENESLLWGTAEIAKHIRRKEETVQRLLKRGDLPGRKVGKLWVATKEELADPAKWCREREPA